MKTFDKGGFTLIEILISMAILVIGILAVLALFPVGFDSANRSADLTKATIYAQNTMEELKRLGYPVTTAASGVFTDPKFSYTIYTTQVASTGSLVLTTVRISWNYKGRPFNEDFVTLIPSLGP
jgi:uncharacterized protein (TIGR02598 family)